MQVGLTLKPGKGYEKDRMELVLSYPLAKWSWVSGPGEWCHGALIDPQQSPGKGREFHVTVVQHGLQWFMGRCNPHSSTGCRLRYVPQYSSSVCSFYAKDSWWTFTLYPKPLCRPCIYLVTKWLLSTPSQERKDPKCDCELPSPPGPMHGSVLASS